MLRSIRGSASPSTSSILLNAAHTPVAGPSSLILQLQQRQALSTMTATTTTRRVCRCGQPLITRRELAEVSRSSRSNDVSRGNRSIHTSSRRRQEVAPHGSLASRLDTTVPPPPAVEATKAKSTTTAASPASSPTPTTTTPTTATATPAPSSLTKTSTPSRPPRREFKAAKAAISMTPTAVSQIQGLLASPTPKLIRIGVRNKGCAGMSYHLEYVDKPGKFDEVVEQDGVKVLIDSKALFSIVGSVMDWQEDKISAKFVFNNPNIKEQCGCGESFLT